VPFHRSEKVDDVKRRILGRLEHGFYQSGDRFLSNRDVAELFGVSYQTAHRLISELCDEGVLERRPQSGTYVPGGVRPLIGAELLFHPRSAAPESFGAKLLALLTRRLDAERIDWKLSHGGVDATPALDRLPVVWECPVASAGAIDRRRPAILIDDRPHRGLESLFIDSVWTDDFSGGACAAQLLATQTRAARGFTVLAGPDDDPRSRMRVEGFLSVLPATVISAGAWFFAEGLAAADKVIATQPVGLFCCNDQLAAAVIKFCREQRVAPPPLVGFDDAPIAETLNLTTIGIPWDELVDGVVRIAKRRLAGDRSTSSHQMFHPRPVIRASNGG
jgi:hypothetical protein